MGFYSTTLESKNASGKTPSCPQKTASRKNFSSNRKFTYKIERNPLNLQQGTHPAPTKTASGIPYWPSRDPLEEGGDSNLYVFVSNDPIGSWDYLGLRGVDSITANAARAAARGDMTELNHLLSLLRMSNNLTPQKEKVLRKIALEVISQSIQSQPAPSNSGGSPNTTTAEDRRSSKPCTCECVTDANTIDHGKTDMGGVKSWEFTIQAARVVIKTQDPADSGNVDLKWLETSNRLPAIYGLEPGLTSVDLVRHPLYLSSPVFSKWRSRNMSPGTSDVIEFLDNPAADVLTYGGRHLNINVVFRNPMCCKKRGYPLNVQVIAIHSAQEYTHNTSLTVHTF